MQLADANIGDIWKWSGGSGKGGFSTLADIASTLFPKILLLGSIVAFIIIIIAGFGVLSGAGSGDAQATEGRKQILTYAIIGLIIMFGAFWILQIINFVTNGSLNSILR